MLRKRLKAYRWFVRWPAACARTCADPHKVHCRPLQTVNHGPYVRNIDGRPCVVHAQRRAVLDDVKQDLSVGFGLRGRGPVKMGARYRNDVRGHVYRRSGRHYIQQQQVLIYSTSKL